MNTIYWISGNYYDCSKKWKSILKLYKKHSLTVFDCGPKSELFNNASDIIMSLKHKDMFDTGTTILKIKGLPHDYTLLTDYLNLANENQILVIDSPIGYYPSDGGRFVTAATSKFYKKIQDIGEVCVFPQQAKTFNEAVKWVVNTTMELGKRFDEDAAKMLVESRGYDLDILYSEIIRLIDFQVSRKINIEDVKTCCVPSFLKTVWNLIDDLDNKNFDSVISHMQLFYANAGNEVGTTFRGEVENLLGALYQHFLFLLLIKGVCGDTLSYNGAMKAVGGFKKRTKVDNKYNWDKSLFETNFVQFNLRKPSLQSIVRWPKPKVYSVFRNVINCRLVCRMATDESDIRLYLDSLVMSICDKHTKFESYMKDIS